MPYLLNVLYLAMLLLISPWLIFKALTTGKYRRGMVDKFLGRTTHPLLAQFHRQRKPIVWFHGVSVGEIHLLRQVIARFRQRRPDCGCVVSTTTDTGFDEAQKCFADLPVIFWPLDFTWAVKRALATVAPTVVVLAEGEMWPNFVLAAKRRGVKVAVVNGRMSPRSRQRFGYVRALMSRLLSQIDLIAAQTREVADNFRYLGAVNVQITGSVKYDGAEGNRDNARTQALRKLFGVDANDLVWIAGSTQAPEEQMVLDIFGRLKNKLPQLRLFLVPRQKDRFEEVAQLLQQSDWPHVRRSELTTTCGLAHKPAVVLMDTIGELGALWGLADVAFVGGSLGGKRGGQNMIEPAAYGAAVLFGPHTWNFKETVTQLLGQHAAVQISDATELEQETLRLLTDVALRHRVGSAARQFVLSQQGATQRTLDLLDHLLPAVKVQAA